MSWNFAGINFKKNYGDDYSFLLRQLELDDVKTAENLTFSRALSLIKEGTALGIVNDKTVLLNELLPYDCSYQPGEEGWLDEILEPLSSEGDILNYIVDGVSGTYGFSWFSGGRRLRRWAVEPDNVLVDEGPLMAGETTVSEGSSARAATADNASGLFKLNQDAAHLMAVWEAFLGLSFQELLRDDRRSFDFFSSKVL